MQHYTWEVADVTLLPAQEITDLNQNISLDTYINLQYSSRATSRTRALASLATRVPRAIHTQAPVQVNCGVALGLQKYSSIFRVFESSIAS